MLCDVVHVLCCDVMWCDVYTHTHIHTHTHTHTLSLSLSLSLTHTHTCVMLCHVVCCDVVCDVYTHTHTLVLGCLMWYVVALCGVMCTHAHTHIHTHAHIHTHTLTHTYTLSHTHLNLYYIIHPPCYQALSGSVVCLCVCVCRISRLNTFTGCN